MLHTEEIEYKVDDTVFRGFLAYEAHPNQNLVL